MPGQIEIFRGSQYCIHGTMYACTIRLTITMLCHLQSQVSLKRHGKINFIGTIKQAWHII